MHFVLLIAIALLAFVIHRLPTILKFWRLYQFSCSIPGPSVLELIKHAKEGRILAWFNNLRKKYGTVFGIWFGRDLVVFFTDPDDVRQVLGSNVLLEKSRNYTLVEGWLGKGLLTNGGASWFHRRKLLTPAFHFRILSEFKEPMEDNCKILITKLREKADGGVLNIYPYITLFALDAICETAMGIKKNAQLESNSPYVVAVQTICHLLHKRSFSFWQRFEIFYAFSESKKRVSAAIKVLHDETIRVIQLRRQILQEARKASAATDDAQAQVDEFGAKRRLAFLDMLLISQMESNNLSDLEIREEVDTFMFEGHDTTSSALAFAIYLLSQHADIQQRAYEEAVACQGREKDSMPYLEAIIKETLRLYPSVPFFSRLATDDIQIGKITVPKGSAISTLAYMVHRDEKYFPDPEKFDPERFLNASTDLHPFAFVAFSAGPRNCIGQKFAMLELKVCLSALLRNFELLPVANFKPNPLAELVMKSGNGIQIRLKERK